MGVYLAIGFVWSYIVLLFELSAHRKTPLARIEIRDMTLFFVLLVIIWPLSVLFALLTFRHRILLSDHA